MTAVLDEPDTKRPSDLRRLIGISTSLVGTQAATSILGLAFWGLAARQFTVEAVGVAGVAVSLMTLLGTAGTAGLGTLLIARLPLTAPGQRRVLVQTALLLAAVVTMIICLLVPVAAIHLLHAANLRSIAGDPAHALLFAAGTALMAVTIVLDQAVLTVGNGTLQLERNVLASAVKLAALAGLSAAGGHGGMIVFTAWTIGSLVSLPLVAWRSRSRDAEGQPGRRVDLSVMRGLVRAALGHHALNITLMIPLLLLPVVVTVALSPRDNGIFTGALQITGFVFALPYAVSVALFAAAEGNQRHVVERMSLTIPFGLGVSLLANVALFPVAPAILHLFGSVYAAQGAVILRLLVLAGLPFVIKDHFVALRRVQGRTGQATAVLAAFTAAELGGAIAGAISHGLTGLCLAWVSVLYAQIPVLAVPLVRAARAVSRTGPDTGLVPMQPEGLDAVPEAVHWPAPLLPARSQLDRSVVLPPPPSSLSAPIGGRLAGPLTAPITASLELSSVRPSSPATASPALRTLRSLRSSPITAPIKLDSLLRGPTSPPPQVRARKRGGGRRAALDPFLRWPRPGEDDLPTATAEPDEASFPDGLSRNGLTGPAILLMALGLVLMSTAVSTARSQGPAGLAQLLYVGSLILIVLPPAAGVLLPGISNSNRILMAVALPVTVQLTRLVLYPTRFMFHDELLHANLLRLIDASGRLFQTNPLLPITAYYPGLEVATSAVQALTGLPAHVSAVVVLMAARVVLALAVLLVIRQITGSSRIAATASVIYTTNPQMLFFNSQFSYQSLALPLAVLTVYLFLSRRRDHWTGLISPVTASAAVVFTHHVTGGLLLLALIVWWMLDLVIRRGEHSESGALASMVLATAGFLGASLANPGNSLTSYLGAIALSSGQAVEQLAAGDDTKQAFKNSAGIGPQPWEQMLILASLALTLLVLLPALWHVRHWLRRRVTVAVLFALIAMLYPLIPGGHLTVSTAEVGDRSAGFVFLGVGFVVACWLWRRRPTAMSALVAGAGTTVVFLGGVILGAGATAQQLPGPFQVSADARSIDGASIAAADWERMNLAPDSVVYADRVGGLLAAAYGHQFTVRHISTGVDASRLLLDRHFTSADIALIQRLRIDYVIADRRDALGLPNQQVYIESGEFGGGDRGAPVPLAALTKFDAVRGVSRIFDNGAVAVYDVRSLQDVSSSAGS